ncbi:BspA family leucine-rich repeat surface protein [Mycoplasma feriruminatoris]|uniref:BspA family leucine-rich repeat surface protein n=1 Tax=Mycoplasma feriruminatoris TaxID=1179777 RepID=A0A654IPJ7_9MOLU|nr:BspA family leucine-rich repeat surface protein [Mycoplasma feriruminatoris]WFQ95384.1 BspA family leucine-rich repeat surface protein [Mycoplasma feriruminatoris]VZS00676.1 hypothetical protein MF5582_00718 [Mycoplasma feriruminatoris]
MKKILTTLSSFSLIATSTILVVSCKTDRADKKIEQPGRTPESKMDKEKDKKDSKTPDSRNEMSQGDQPRNESENGSNSSSKHNDNIFSSTEDERPYIKGYSEWIDKSKTDDIQHFINPYDPNEILILGYTKSVIGRKTEFVLKQIPKNVKKVPKSLPNKITSIEGAFKDNENVTIEGIENWDTSRVTNMNKAFHGAKRFNGDITNWKTDNVDDVNYMFFSAESFNRNLSKWKLPKTFYSNTFDKYSGIQDKKELFPQFKKTN